MRGPLTLVAWNKLSLLVKMTRHGTIHLLQADFPEFQAAGTWTIEDLSEEEKSVTISFSPHTWPFGHFLQRRSLHLKPISTSCYFSKLHQIYLFAGDKTEQLSLMERHPAALSYDE